MALVAEYALTPDVFDSTSYASSEVCALHLQALKEVLLQEGLVRNLRGGDWARVFAVDTRPWHLRAKELLRKLVTQHRLIPRPSSLAIAPTTDAQWCDEALATHAVAAVNGIIVTNGIAGDYATKPIVSAVERLATAPWWASRSPSIRLERTLPEYQAALALVLRHANHIMFVDPHVDPGEPRYRDLATLIQGAAGRTPAPNIEIHRVCYRGSGRDRVILNCADIEATFRLEMGGRLAGSGLSVEVFVWDDFHDRYLVSNIVGILVPNGFDTTGARSARTTWARLGREQRDDVQREFDPASRRHALRARFVVP